MKKKAPKLSLNRETLHRLDPSNLKNAIAAADHTQIGQSCYTLRCCELLYNPGK